VDLLFRTYILWWYYTWIASSKPELAKIRRSFFNVFLQKARQIICSLSIETYVSIFTFNTKGSTPYFGELAK
jgi:hypothetical protein